MATKKVLEYQVKDAKEATFFYDKYSALRYLKNMGPEAKGYRCQIRLKGNSATGKLLSEKVTTKFFG